MEFSDDVKAVVNDVYLPGAADGILNGNVITMRILGNAKFNSWKGEKVSKTFIYQTAGNGGSFSGLDLHNTNKVGTKVKLQIDARGYEKPIVVPQMELDVAGSDQAAQLDALALAIEEATNEASDAIGTILYGDGTGNDNKDFLGLDAIADDGGEVATYAGQSRSTYTQLKGKETDLGGALTIAAMASMFDNVTVGNKKPTIILTTKDIWSDYEALHATTVQANYNVEAANMAEKAYLTVKGVTPKGFSGNTGFQTLSFRGVPVVADDKAPSGKMFLINETVVEFLRLKSALEGAKNITPGGNKQVEGVYQQQFSGGAGFDMTQFVVPVNQYAKFAHIYLLGNLVCFNPRLNGVINTIS